MEIVTLCMVHGFLGVPEDWSQVETHLRLDNIPLEKINLLEDFQKLDNSDFLTWARKIQQQFQAAKGRRVFVGYSLGGRLLMHLNLMSEDKVVLLGSHPGLLEGKKEREQNDANWLKKGQNLTKHQWLQEWNKQDVFRNDSVRPIRDFTEEEFKCWLQVLSHWSLSKQELRDSWLKSFKKQVYWACGSSDKKFVELKESRIKGLLPENHIFEIEDSGHGVIFDNPIHVAQIIQGVL